MGSAGWKMLHPEALVPANGRILRVARTIAPLKEPIEPKPRAEVIRYRTGWIFWGTGLRPPQRNWRPA
jgi:hypothetical protein